MPLGLWIMQLGLELIKPDYTFITDQTFDWTHSVYGHVHKILPDDMPEPIRKMVVTTTTMDSNLNHYLATGKSFSGCLHFVNKHLLTGIPKSKPL